MAAALFDQMTDGRHEVSSAGTQVVNKAGESRDGQSFKDMQSGIEHVIGALKEKGIDASNSIRRQLKPEMADQADLIVVMAEPKTIPDYLNNSDKVTYFEVEDPKDTSFEKHKEVRDKIEQFLEGFIQERHL